MVSLHTFEQILVRAFDHRWCCFSGWIPVFARQNRREGEKKSERESHSPGKRQIKKPVARTLGHLSRKEMEKE